MIKALILDCCEFCDGEAYIFVCEDVDSRGETFDRYRHPEPVTFKSRCTSYKPRLGLQVFKSILGSRKNRSLVI